VIEKILTHLGLQADCGRMTAPARGHAPQEGLALASASAARGAGRRRARQPVDRSCKRPDVHQQHVSGGPVPWAAGIGCAGDSQSRGLPADGKGKPECEPFERRTSALRSAFNLR